MDTFQADSHLEGAAKNTHPEDLAEVMDFSGYDSSQLLIDSFQWRVEKNPSQERWPDGNRGL